MVELDHIIKHMREKTYEEQRFIAAMKGIDLDKENKKSTTVEEVRRRAAARLAGGEEVIEQRELADLGFGYETD